MPNAEVVVVGTKFEGRQDILASLHRAQEQGMKLAAGARLVREPENPYDPNAIAVVIGGSKAGHIPRALAERWSSRMDGGEKIPVTAVRIITDGKGHFDARISVELAEREEAVAGE